MAVLKSGNKTENMIALLGDGQQGRGYQRGGKDEMESL